MIWNNLSVKRYGDVGEKWTIKVSANKMINGDKYLTILLDKYMIVIVIFNIMINK